MRDAAAVDWDNLNQLGDAELAMLVEVAVDVIQEGAVASDNSVEVRGVPPDVLRRELATELEASGMTHAAATAAVASEDNRAREASIALLVSAAAEPSVRSEIEQAYVERKGMMFADPVTLSALAFLVLAIKVTRIKIGRGGAEVTFGTLKADALGWLKALVPG